MTFPTTSPTGFFSPFSQQALVSVQSNNTADCGLPLGAGTCHPYSYSAAKNPLGLIRMRRAKHAFACLFPSQVLPLSRPLLWTLVLMVSNGWDRHSAWCVSRYERQLRVKCRCNHVGSPRAPWFFVEAIRGSEDAFWERKVCQEQLKAISGSKNDWGLLCAVGLFGPGGWRSPIW